MDDRKKYNSMEPLLQKIQKHYISLSDADIKRNNEILQSIVIPITDKMKENDNLFAAIFDRIFYGGSYFDGLKVAHPDEYDLDLLLTIPSQMTYKLGEASNLPGFMHLKFKNRTPYVKKMDPQGKHKANQEEMKTTPVQRNQPAHYPQHYHGYDQPPALVYEPHYYETLGDYEPRYYHQAHGSTSVQPRRQHNFARRERGMGQLINAHGYLDTSQVLQWTQKVLQKALNTFRKDCNGRYILETDYGNFYAKIFESGPAYTLQVTGTIGNDEINMAIDLVPCFVFGNDRWPRGGGFRENPIDQKPNFFIVPKQIRGISNASHYWRLSFQEQERVLLDGKEKLKPTIKLLKKMRDFLRHDVIASYFIKTVALWAIDEKEPDFWSDNSLSYVFMTVLKNYQKCLESGKIQYYWNKHHNLLVKINPAALININNKVRAIIDDVERHSDNPLLIGKYLVSSEELIQLKQKYMN